MQPTRWLPCTLVALLAACGPATEDDHLARMAHEHRDDSPETGAADRETPSSQGAEVVYASLDGTEVMLRAGRGMPSSLRGQDYDVQFKGVCDACREETSCCSPWPPRTSQRSTRHASTL